MYSSLVRDKLIRKKPLLSDDHICCIVKREKREFTRRESPLIERDGYFTDESTDDNIPKTHGRSLPRQLLGLMAPLLNLNPLADLNTELFPTALNMRSILGGDHFHGILERLKIVSDAGKSTELVTVKEGKWLMCALILYEALEYLQKYKENGHTLNFEENDQTYVFNPEDLNALIWICLSEGKRTEEISRPISDTFLRNVFEQWRTGQRLSSLITRT